MKYTSNKAYEDVVALAKRKDGVVIKDDKVVLDPSALKGNVSWKDWVTALRYAAFFNQRNRCLCDERFIGGNAELHHALISKQDIRGSRTDENNRVVQHTYNVVLLHKKCHLAAVRHRCWAYLISTYGEDNVRQWYDVVSGKTTLRRF